MNAWQEWKKNMGSTKPWDAIRLSAERVDESVSDSRLAICEDCPELLKVTKQCKKCGCFMTAKTKLALAECPIGKWGKIDVKSGN